MTSSIDEDSLRMDRQAKGSSGQPVASAKGSSKNRMCGSAVCYGILLIQYEHLWQRVRPIIS